MFSYIDPSIVDLLLREKRLRHVDRQGRDMANGAAKLPYLSILGPVPLPITLEGGAEAMVRVARLCAPQ